MKKIRYLIGALVSLGVLYLILRNLDFDQIWHVLHAADYVWLIPATLAMLGMLALRGLRWRAMLDSASDRVSFTDATTGVFIGYFGNLTLGSNLGEVLRTIAVGSRLQRSKSAVLGSVVVEKALDVTVLVGYLVALMAFLTLPGWIEQMTLIGGGLWIAIALTLVLIPALTSKIATHLTLLTKIHIPATWIARLQQLLANFTAGLQLWRHRRKALLGIGALSCAIWLILAVAFACVGQALRIASPIESYLLLVILITLGAMIPSLPGQIGTTEFLITEGFAIFGIHREKALAFAVLLRLIRLVPIALGYVVALREGIRLPDVRRKAEQT